MPAPTSQDALTDPRWVVRQHRRAGIVVALIAMLVVGAGLAYLGAGVFLYEQISRVGYACSSRFEGVTPANLDYHLAQDDLAGSLVIRFDLASYRMPDYREVSFPSRPDAQGQQVAIRGWWIPGASPDAPAVILVHGRDSCRKDWTVQIPAAMLHRAGFATLLIDLRNQGSSDLTEGPTRGRYYGGIVEYPDVLGARDWLIREQGLAASQIGLFGTSMGAAVVIMAAAHEPSAAAVWADSSFADTQLRVAEEISQKVGAPFTVIAPGAGIVASLVAGVDIYGESPLSDMTLLRGRPLFIVHGAGDLATLPHHADDLYARAQREGVLAERWIVPFAGHTWEVVVAPAEYEQRLVAFFREHLAAGAAAR
ncbi:MAG: alpha/beta hydrolase [Candidatus Limnocylindrales bacterium]